MNVCTTCGLLIQRIDIRCQSCKDKGKEVVLQEFCRCVHPGDMLCPYHYRVF